MVPNLRQWLGLHHGDLNIPMGNSHLSLGPWHRKYIGFIIDDSVGLAYALWYHPASQAGQADLRVPPGGPWKVRARRCRCRGRVEGASCSKWADLVGNSSGIEVVDCCWVLIYNGLWCAWQWKITKENMGKIKNQHIFRYMGGFAARVMSTPDYLIINWGLVIINPGLTWKIPKTLDEDPYLIHCWDT